MEVTVKRPTTLVKAMLRQLSLDLDLSVERDVITLSRRCEHEGLSFLTITLPTLSDALERGLEAGTFTCPDGFSRHGSLPRFMGGFFKRVFTKEGGLHDEPCPYAIAGIRQVCRFFKKLKLECSPKRNAKAVQHFIDVEGELRRLTSHVERRDETLDKISRTVWAQVFPELDPLDLVCHHGPGVTADRYLSNERHRLRKWNHRSELTFPSDLHCYPNYGIAAEFGGNWEGCASAGGVEYLKVGDELPVRVVFVPKTQTTPRVIAIEPSHMQYMQQSVKDYMYRVLESHPLTFRSIRFSRQDVNQSLAYRASIDKRLATLDLKDASDRVHLHLVQRIFKNSGLLEYLEDARSLHALLPNGVNVVLSKYASMGSALCFPVEACVFYTLIQSAMHILDGVRPSSRSIRRYSRKIDIYGDDLIVPVEYADFVVSYLESYALKVNVSKSFKSSNFRESCGADYFKGVPVNPVYARELPHDSSRDWTPSTVMSWAATSDLFYERGQWHIAQAIRDMVHQVTKVAIPRARKPGAGVAFRSFLFDTNCHYDSQLHNWRQRRLVYQPTKKKDDINGDEIACLNRWGLQSYRSEPARDGNNGVLRRFESIGPRSVGDSQNPILRAGNDRVLPEDLEVRQCSHLHGLGGVHGGTGTTSLALESAGGRSHVFQVCHLCSASGEHLDAGNLSDLQPLGKSGCVTWEPDRMSHLTDDSVGLDFHASVKRGGFKSKRRWVTLAG
nr:MAG: hypothetical protein 3 [Leviviridae sp.]